MWLVGIFICLCWILSLCIHEFAHAAVAYRNGDISVKDTGYFNLNLFQYTHPGISLWLPFFCLLFQGIGLPGGAIYLTPNRLRNRWRIAEVFAAGPLANAVFALLLLLPFWLKLNSSSAENWLWLCLGFVIVLQIQAILLSLLPIPPFDGYGMIRPWLPQLLRDPLDRVNAYGMGIAIGLLWLVPQLKGYLWQTTYQIVTAVGLPISAAMDGVWLSNRPAVRVTLVVGLLVSGGWLWKTREDYRSNFKAALEAIQSSKVWAVLSKRIKLPQASQKWYCRANQLKKVQQYEEALAAYEQAIILKPDYWQALYERAKTLFKLQQYGDALTAFEDVLVLQDKLYWAWYGKAKVLTQLQRYDEAILAYWRAVELNPAAIEVWHDRVALYEQRQNYEEAIDCYEKMIQLKPKDVGIKQQKARLLEKLGRYEEALVLYEQSIKHRPEDANAWYSRGLVLEKLHQPDAALAAYEKAIAVCSELYQALSSRSSAESNELKISELNSDFYPAWYQRGFLLFQLKRYDEAILSLTKAVNLKPDWADAWYNLARCYACQHDANNAIDSLQQAIRLAPARLLQSAQIEPEFDCLQESPRFQCLLQTPTF